MRAAASLLSTGMPLIVFESPLGLPVLAPLAGLQIAMPADEWGSAGDNFNVATSRMLLVAPSLLIAVAASAARAAVSASPAPADARVLLTQGTLMAQVREVAKTLQKTFTHFLSSTGS